MEEQMKKGNPNYFELCSAFLVLLAVFLLAWFIAPEVNQSTNGKEIEHEYNSESIYNNDSIRAVNDSSSIIY